MPPVPAQGRFIESVKPSGYLGFPLKQSTT